jgi:hypothetical protein
VTGSTPPPVGSFTGSVGQLLELEKMRRAVEALADDARVKAATVDLVSKGAAAISPLLEALERRDAVLRRRAFEVLKHVTRSHGPLDYDPDAATEVRMRQVAYLRVKLERRR